MNHRRLTHLFAAAALVLLTTVAPAQDKGLKRLVPGGDDGASRTYVARCLDGASGTVNVLHASGDVCATAQGGKEKCDKKWTLMEAGQHACGAKGSR